MPVAASSDGVAGDSVFVEVIGRTKTSLNTDRCNLVAEVMSSQPAGGTRGARDEQGASSAEYGTRSTATVVTRTLFLPLGVLPPHQGEVAATWLLAVGVERCRSKTVGRVPSIVWAGGREGASATTQGGSEHPTRKSKISSRIVACVPVSVLAG